MKDIFEMTKEEIEAITPEQASAMVREEIARSNAIRREIQDFLYNNGEVIDLGKWVTAKEYSERFGVSINRVTNWIKRGIIPKENVRRIKALNDIRLIKAIPYKDI